MVDDIPKFNLTRIRNIRHKVFSRVFAGRIDEVMDAEMLIFSVRDMKATIPVATRDAIMETLRVYIGEVLTEELCVRISWQVAGNVALLKAGIPVRSWAGQSVGEWMPLQLLKLKPVLHFGKIKYECSFKILAGSACPMTITRHMSQAALKYVARVIGFSRASGKFPYKHVMDLTGIRLLGHFTPELVRDRQPSFREISCPSVIVKWNRDNYISVRTRKLPCPQQFNHDCVRCAYGTDRCRYAIHPTTYVLGYCAECDDNSAAFAPDDDGPLCVKCLAKQELRPTLNR